MSKDLSALLEIIESENNSLKSKVKIFIGVWVVIAIIVIAYTSFVFSHLSKEFAPARMAEQGEAVVNKLASQPEQIIAMYDENKDVWANHFVDEGLKQVPELEKLIKNQIDLYGQKLTSEMKGKFFPAMSAYLKGSSSEIKAAYADAKKKNAELTLGEYLTELIVIVLMKEFDKIIDIDAAIEKGNGLNKGLYELSKDKHPISKLEVAERKILVNLILISKLKDMDGSPILDDLSDFLKKQFGVTGKQVNEIKAIDETIKGSQDGSEEL
ncbi:MAG: hypothetical protein HRT89_08360 [Lentisphaeria bacterium]|nr:hypothetical protein [Lentisphaeria bacterium]NQZ68068.1 hypothetical protein [Lentisphaeria bacterium]